MRVFQICENSYLGDVLEFPDGDGIPLGYTRTSPPSVKDGYFVRWGFNGWEVTKEPPPKPKEPLRVVSKLAFLNRLTDDEYVNMLSASKTNIAIEAWFNKFNLMENVLLNTLNMDIFVRENILSEDRITQILKSPVQDHERPN